MIDPDFEIEATEPTLCKLTAHPHASLFPMMPDGELDELATDIKEHGQREPIVLFEGQILDGRNRVEACRKIGIEPKTVQYDGDDPAAFVISANLHRRHLTPAQKQEVVEKLLAAQPKWSDRAIGKLALVDHKTVGTRRAELEARGEIPRVERRADTKGRSYPVARDKKAGPSAAPQISASASAAVASIDALHESDIRRHLDELLRLLRNEKARIAELPEIEREVWAREYFALFDIPADNLKPITEVPEVEPAEGLSALAEG